MNDHKLRLLILTLFALVAAACGGAETPAETAEPSGAAPVAGAPLQDAPPRPHGKVAACTTDASCNADPAISALWGKCDVETGKCSCVDGVELDPIAERCSPKP